MTTVKTKAHDAMRGFSPAQPHLFGLLILALMISACSSSRQYKIDLMPAPAVFQDGVINPLPEGSPPISYDDFRRMDLRVGTVVSVSNIEGADRVYRLEIDLGSESRTCVAGVKSSYAADELLGKSVVVLANLDVRESALAQNGAFWATLSTEGRVQVRDTLDGKEVFSSSEDDATAVALDRAGELLAIGRSDGTVEVWNVPTSEPLRTFHDHEESIAEIAFQPSGNTLAACDTSGTIHVWSMSAGQKIHSSECRGCQQLLFTNGGRGLLAADSATNTVLLWEIDAEDNEEP